MGRIGVAFALALAALGTLPAGAGAERWFTVPVSGENDTASTFAGAAPDGSLVLFTSGSDVYSRTATGVRNETADIGRFGMRAVSADASSFVFESNDNLTADDQDEGDVDLYERSGGVTRLVSAPDPALPVTLSLPFYQPLVGVSADGRIVAFSTSDKLSADDTTFRSDVYVWDRDTGVATLASGHGGLGFFDVNIVPRMVAPDGSAVYMTTMDQLLPDDGDFGVDVYRFDTATNTLSLATPDTSQSVTFGGISADGGHVYFTTAESLSSDDSDGRSDVYERADGQTTLVSNATGFGNGDFDAGFQRGSGHGEYAYFTTQEKLASDDDDSDVDDLYRRRSSDGEVELVSTGPGETFKDAGPIFSNISADGSRAFFYTAQDLTADDNDGAFADAFEYSGGDTTRISVGEQNDDDFSDSSFAGHSATGGFRFFQTEGQFATDDHDAFDDLYARHDGHTALVTSSPGPCKLLPSTRCAPVWQGNSADGRRVWFESDERLDGADASDATDVFESRLAVPATLAATAAAQQREPDSAAGPVDQGLAVSGPYGELFAATVRVADGLAGGDKLTYAEVHGIHGVVTGSALELTGRASEADYQDALRSVKLEAPGAGVRTVEFTADDGAGPSAAVSRQVVVAAPKVDDPVVPGTKSDPIAPPPDTSAAPAEDRTVALRVQDTGVALAHLRRPGFFRVPGLVFFCPRTVAEGCRASVTVSGQAIATGAVDVPPGDTRGIRLTLGSVGERRLRRHGQLRLHARIVYTGGGATSAVSAKDFLVVPISPG